jgi:subtilisin family serine protease
MDFAFFPVEFDKSGSPVNAAQADALLAAAGNYPHVFVVSHGWNNDMADAQSLYDALFAQVGALLGVAGAPIQRNQVAVAGVFWPSKKFADSDLIPGGAAAMGAGDEAAARIALEGLAVDPDRLGNPTSDPDRLNRIEQAKALISRLEGDPAARREFVALLRTIQPRTPSASPDDGTDALFDRDADVLLGGLVAPVLAPPPTTAGSPAAALSLGGFVGGIVGGVRDLGNGFVAAARRLANIFTYYQMKDRAGIVGQKGLGAPLVRLRQTAPATRIHLVGHSFGARVVTAAADTLQPRTPGISLTLLQGAYSHNGLAARFDGVHDGFFRHVVSDRKIAGPIAITYTKNDLAVGVAYPLASRIANQVASALGDANDPYGGMGRNGAQRMSPGEMNLDVQSLLPRGQVYEMRPGVIHNLNSDAFITGHSDITKPEVAQALLAVAATTPAPDGTAMPFSRPIGGAAAMPTSARPSGSSGGNSTAGRQTEFGIGLSVMPPKLNDPSYRKQLRLPTDETTPGPYLVELNILHEGGLPEALRQFRALWKKVIGPRDPSRSEPVVISKTYVRCSLSVDDCRQLAQVDAADAADVPKRRAIYKVWPDFPVQAHVDRSIATVKADAAYRAYSASGEGMTWAVIDSGINADHPHFGGATTGPHHILRSEELQTLHRCFVDLADPNAPGAGPVPIPDPDDDRAGLTLEERSALVRWHRDAALQDPFGHGTHVAGIIAGGLSPEALAPPAGTAAPATSPPRLRVFEQTFETNGMGNGVVQYRYTERTVADCTRLRGIAPRCKLVSLRVLDADGRGRSSDVIRALEYIRERINGDPKLLRIHGVNLSVGYEFDAEVFACGQSPLCVEVNRLVRSGVVVVTAAGNTGYGNIAAQARPNAKAGLSNTINDPGNADMAITVGSTHRDAPFTYGVSYFSSKGPTGDGRSKPDLVAPGERITSCAAGRNLRVLCNGNGTSQTPPAASDAVYLDESGTSMAAPHVSGAIAAFLSIRREFVGRPWDVKQIFLDSATSLGREKYFEGHGMLDLMRAIQSV